MHIPKNELTFQYFSLKLDCLKFWMSENWLLQFIISYEFFIYIEYCRYAYIINLMEKA